MDQKAINEALKRRKLGALDITILLGDNSGAVETPANQLAVGGEEDEEKEDESEELDLAPEASEVGEETDKMDEAMAHDDAEADKMLIAEELKKMGLIKNSMIGRKDKALSKT